MVQLSSSAAVVGIHGFDRQGVEASQFQGSYERITGVCDEHSVALTYVGAEGEGYSGKYSKLGGRTHRRLLSSGFRDVSILSLVANPSGSDAPAYDSFLVASLSHLKETAELLLCVVVNEGIVSIQSDAFLDLLRNLACSDEWTCGYAFASPAAKQPELYVLGMDSGDLSEEERTALTSWYVASAEDRSRLLRDVYPYSILNERHLQLDVRGRPLRDFAETQAKSELLRLGPNGLWLWKLAGRGGAIDTHAASRCGPVDLTKMMLRSESEKVCRYLAGQGRAPSRPSSMSPRVGLEAAGGLVAGF